MPHPDSEALPEEVVLHTAFSRAMSNFNDDEIAQDIAFTVADKFSATWEYKMAHQSQKDNGNNPGENPAYYLDAMITGETSKQKDILIKQHRKGKKSLSKEDFWLWFIEDLMDYAKARKSPYMATVMMVLCDWPSFKVPALYAYLADSRTGEVRDDSTFRRYKLNYIIPALSPRYGPFTEIQQIARNEKRYVKDADATDKEHLRGFESWLEQLTPLHPQCFLPERDLDSNDIQGCINANTSAYPDGVERNRKHTMQCPRCLSKLLATAGFADWKLSFRPPKVTLRGPDSGGGNFSQRTQRRMLSPQPLAMMKKMLGRRNIRRQRLSHKTLFVAVGNEAPRKIRVNQKIELELNDGDRLIQVSGKDWRGRLPLDTHLISWNEDLVRRQPIIHRTFLKEDRVLQFSIKYQPGMAKATAVVDYVRISQHSPATTAVVVPSWQDFAAAGALAAAGFAFLLLTTLANSVLLKNRTAPPAADDARLNANSNISNSKSNNSAPAVTSSANAATGESDQTVDTVRIASRRQSRSAGEDYLKSPKRKRSRTKQEYLKSANSRQSETVEAMGSAAKIVKKIKNGVAAVGNAVFSGVRKLVSASPLPANQMSNPDVRNGNKGTLCSLGVAGQTKTGPYVMMDKDSPVTSYLYVLSGEPNVVGVVTDSNDQPVPLANILLKPHGCEAQDASVLSNGQPDVGIGALSKTDGGFTVSHASDGKYDLIVTKAGFVTARKDGITVVRGARVPSVHIRLQFKIEPEVTQSRSGANNEGRLKTQD